MRRSIDTQRRLTMPNKSPHIIIAAVVWAIAHYAQLGTELMERLLPKGSVPASFSDLAVAISLALFVIYLVPPLCRGILATYGFLGRTYDRCYAWAKRALAKFARWMLARLSQDDPLSKGEEHHVEADGCSYTAD
jgi:hypothetical protein